MNEEQIEAAKAELFDEMFYKLRGLYSAHFHNIGDPYEYPIRELLEKATLLMGDKA